MKATKVTVERDREKEPFHEKHRTLIDTGRGRDN